MNYKNMDYIEVYPSSGGYIKIEDSEDIEKILDNFNSLKVIKEKIPSKSKLEYHGEGKYEEYLERLRETGAFSISFHGSSSDRIYFTNEYFTIYHNGYDWDYTEYYIIDSGYNPEDNSSKFYDFMVELISKYVEEQYKSQTYLKYSRFGYDNLYFALKLINTDGIVIKTYIYDAFGVEKNIDDADTNAFRYCGEYYDSETGTLLF